MNGLAAHYSPAVTDDGWLISRLPFRPEPDLPHPETGLPEFIDEPPEDIKEVLIHWQRSYLWIGCNHWKGSPESMCMTGYYLNEILAGIIPQKKYVPKTRLTPEGFLSPSLKEYEDRNALRALLTAVDRSEPGPEVFRGQDMIRRMESLSPGDVFYQPLSGWSDRRHTAAKYVDMAKRNGQFAILMRLAPGPKLFPLDQVYYGNCMHEREHLTGGYFRVKRTSRGQKQITVWVEQIGRVGWPPVALRNPVIELPGGPVHG